MGLHYWITTSIAVTTSLMIIITDIFTSIIYRV